MDRAELVAALEHATMARLGQAHDIVAMVRILATERDEASARIAGLTERLSEMGAIAAEQPRRLDEAARALAASEAALAASKAELAASRSELAASNAELAASRSGLAAAKAELAAAAAARAALGAELATAVGDAGAQRAALQTELAATRAELTTVREAYSNAIAAIDMLGHTRSDLQQQLELTQVALRESERDRTYLLQDVVVKDAYAENLLSATRALELHYQQTLALGRYRVADALNARLKSFARIHRSLKRWLVRVPAKAAAR